MPRGKSMLAAEFRDGEEESASHHLSTDLLDELASCRRGAAGREHIVNDQHAGRRRTCINMHLESVFTILECVVQARASPRQ